MVFVLQNKGWTLPSESLVQRASVKAARKRGWLAIKMHTLTFAGLPDYLFISPTGKFVFIEFKSTTGVLTTLQRFIQKDIASRGVPVYTCRAADEAISYLESIESGMGRTETAVGS